MFQYTAIVSIGHQEISRKSGNELEALYAWMVSIAEKSVGKYIGKIIENNTQATISQFMTRSDE